jgi:poly(beta-D-mannuronate) lyase
VIERNSIIDPARIVFGAGNDAERTAPPISSRFVGNLIAAAKDPFRGEGNVSGIELSGNVVNFAPVMAGMTQRAFKLTRAANGLLYAAGIDAGAPRDLKPVSKAEVGPAWYAKADVTVGFGSGRTHAVQPGGLAKASAAAGAGDTLRLAAGTYAVSAPIAVTKALTIAGPATARISFASAALFQLAEGGSLRFEGLSISGRGAVIRSAPTSTIASYAVEIVGTVFRGVRGDVIATTPSTLADHVTIERASFADVSGTVIAAASETTALGHYPVERIVISDSSFVDVARVAEVARLGTDESTFGPSFTMTNSLVSGGGNPSIRLSGVQATTIARNSFANTGGIVVDHSVGAPATAITGNRFVGTPAPKIAKLYPQGTPWVTLRDNIGITQ